MRITIHAKLITKQDGFYPIAVFQNLEEPLHSLIRFITVTVLPNWNISLPNIGDCGYLEYEYVEAGDPYFERLTGNKELYKYTACYFMNFIKDKEKVITPEYKF